MPAFPTKLTLLCAVLATIGESAPFAPEITSRHQKSATGKAVYLITNAKQNAVVALPIQGDGKLAAGRSTMTGGAGGVMVDAASGGPALPDGLASQSSLTRVGNVSRSN